VNDFIVHLVEGGGYWGIAFLMALENIFPPIPSELIMGLGGVAVARGTMTFWPLLFAGTVGSTVGNYFWFLIGDRVGYQRLRPLVARYGRWLTLEWHEVEKCGNFLRKHGQWVVFGLRFSPLFRTMISLPAGLAHMRHVRFLVFTFAGAAIWNALLILGGHWLGQVMQDAERVVVWVGIVLTAITVAMYVWRLARWKPSAPAE
jgi:membrane protein DedA with SNARE-associated domain